MPSLTHPDISFCCFWAEATKAYKTIFGKKSKHFSKIRKLATLKQFGFLNEKCFDFLHGIWLKRFQPRLIAQIANYSVN
ncbi:hypothetical protein DDZ16_12810 [Marinilabilia rubra]|uniref:Uncharacterized protein n=1 Tax=Marinilabilia rubra TaxID=2162893 RepID=A0A2U2B738_9BACT|nr:hypothetical protein DDZ16_12810 [Marinilabilia rubra]